MAEEAVPPTAARIQRARRAGLRPRAPGLAPALLLFALAAWLDADHPGLATVAAHVEAGLRAPTLAAPIELAALALELLALVLAVGLACAWVAATMTGEIGTVTVDRSVADVRWRRSAWALVVLAVLCAVVIAFATRGVVAGAARAADAGDEALALLWRGWAVRLALVLAGVSLAASLADLWIDRRALVKALHTTVARARDEGRERRGRRA